MNYVGVVQSLSHVWFFVTPRTAARQVSLSFTVSQSLLKLMAIESVMPSNHLILVVPFSSFLQSFKALGSFPMSWLFASGGQNIGASASVFPVNIQGWFPLGWTGLLSLQSKEKNIRGNDWSIRNMIKPLPSHEVLRNTGKEKGKPLLAAAENPSWKHIGCGARNPGDHLSAKQLQAGNGGHFPSNLDITQKPLLCWHCCYFYIFQQ